MLFAMSFSEGGADCNGLADEWDEISSIRDSLRENERLVPENTGTDDIKSAVKIQDVLRPLLVRMRDAGNKGPSVFPLRAAIGALYTKSKQNRPSTDIESDSIVIKKLCTFVKMKCRRIEVSLEPYLPIISNTICFFSIVLVDVFWFPFKAMIKNLEQVLNPRILSSKPWF